MKDETKASEKIYKKKKRVEVNCDQKNENINQKILQTFLSS